MAGFILFVRFPSFTQTDSLVINDDRLSERTLVVWGGKIY